MPRPHAQTPKSTNCAQAHHHKRIGVGYMWCKQTKMSIVMALDGLKMHVGVPHDLSLYSAFAMLCGLQTFGWLSICFLRYVQ